MRTIQRVKQNRQWLRPLALLFVVALISIYSRIDTTGARGVAPSSLELQVPFLTGVTQTISNNSGDQYDPHVTCDLVTFTDDDQLGSTQIRYFDFGTNQEHAIPGNGADFLSDISAGRIAFTEANALGSMVVIFDLDSQTRTVVPGFNHSRSTINANLIAFEDRSFFAALNQSEISVYDITTATTTRLTNDSLFDKNPAVSPSGKAVVWEKCQTDGTGCNIYVASFTSPGVFTTRVITDATGDFRSAEANDQNVVYIANRDGETDLYYQPLAGGAETRISIPGLQRDLSVAGNLIAFESQVETGYDIFVYDLSTSQLYRVTSTSSDETLNDITVCNGTGRIVYASPFMDFDVHSFTFQAPNPPSSHLNDLVALVESFNLRPGIENSLVTKLQNALAAIAVSDITTACDALTSFSNECRAQSGKKLTIDQANELITAATQIKGNLGCQ